MFLPQCQQVTWQTPEVESELGPEATQVLAAWFLGRRTDCRQQELLVGWEGQRTWMLTRGGRTILLFALPHADYDLKAKLDQNRISLECFQQTSDVCHRLLQFEATVDRRPLPAWLSDRRVDQQTAATAMAGLGPDPAIGVEVRIERRERGYVLIPFRVNFDVRVLPDLVVYGLLGNPPGRPSDMDGVAAWLDDLVEVVGWPDHIPAVAETINRMLWWWVFGKPWVVDQQYRYPAGTKRFALAHQCRVGEGYLRRVAELLGATLCTPLPQQLQNERGYRAEPDGGEDSVTAVGYRFATAPHGPREGEFIALWSPVPVPDADWTMPLPSGVRPEELGVGQVVKAYLAEQRQLLEEQTALLLQLEEAKQGVLAHYRELEGGAELIAGAREGLAGQRDQIAESVASASRALREVRLDDLKQASAEAHGQVEQVAAPLLSALTGIETALGESRRVSQDCLKLVAELDGTAQSVHEQLARVTAAVAPRQEELRKALAALVDEVRMTLVAHQRELQAVTENATPQDLIARLVQGFGDARADLAAKLDQHVKELAGICAARRGELDAGLHQELATWGSTVGAMAGKFTENLTAQQQQLEDGVARSVGAIAAGLAARQQQLNEALGASVNAVAETVAGQQQRLDGALAQLAGTALTEPVKTMLAGAQRELVAAFDQFLAQAAVDLTACQQRLKTDTGALPAQFIKEQQQALTDMRQQWVETVRAAGAEVTAAVAAVYRELAADPALAQARQQFAEVLATQTTMSDADRQRLTAAVQEFRQHLQAAMLSTLGAEKQALNEAVQTGMNELARELAQVAGSFSAEDSAVTKTLQTRLGDLQGWFAGALHEAEQRMREETSRMLQEFDQQTAELCNRLATSVNESQLEKIRGNYLRQVQEFVTAAGAQAQVLQQVDAGAQQSVAAIQGTQQQLKTIADHSHELSGRIKELGQQTRDQVGECQQLNDSVAAATHSLGESMERLRALLGPVPGSPQELTVMAEVVRSLHLIRSRLAIADDGGQINQTKEWLLGSLDYIFPVAEAGDRSGELVQLLASREPAEFYHKDVETRPETARIWSYSGLPSKYRDAFWRAAECWLVLTQALRGTPDLTAETIERICVVFEKAWPHSPLLKAHIAAGRALLPK